MNPVRKRGRASLVGGVVVGFAVLALWTLLARDLAPDEPLAIVPGIAFAIIVAVWIRLADL